jgi:hypothetical protein
MRATTRRLLHTGLLVGGIGGLVASALVVDGGAHGTGRDDPGSMVVCASSAVLAPTARIEPYGEVHLVDAVEAAELERGCAHAGPFELTPTCVLWRTEPVPTRTAVLTHGHCVAR